MKDNNTLAKLSLGINAILIILVIVIFSKLQVSVSGESTDIVENDSISSNINPPLEATGKICFFNLDSLNSKIKLFEEIEQEMQNATVDAEKKMQNKQAEITNWEKSWAKKGNLLPSEQEKQMKEAQKIQTDAMEFERNVQMMLQQKQSEWMQTYALRLSEFTKDYAEKNGFYAVYAYQFGQSLWYYNSTLDITNDLANIMNDDFDSNNAQETSEK
jgi:Skp family chaperone for outer membrane proteins